MINNNLQEQKDSLLPPPEILVRYQELGINDDLIELVKAEQKHRHMLQNKYQLSYRVGQIFGLLICLSFISGIFKLASNGYKTEAYIFFGLFSLLLIIITLLLRTNKKQIIRRTTTTTRNIRTNNIQRRGNRNYR